MARIKSVYTNPKQAIDVWVKENRYTAGGRVWSSDDAQVIYSYGTHFALAMRVFEDKILCNADKYSSATAKHQQGFFEHKLPHVPFSALRAAGINISTYEKGFKQLKIVDAWDDQQEQYYDAESDSMKWKHKPGAVLLEWNMSEPARKRKQYICSMDDGRYFVAQMPERYKNLTEAYEGFMPKVVKDYIDRGFQVLRQGEWYFVHQEHLKPKDFNKSTKRYHVNDTHHATNGIKTRDGVFVWGTVRHTRKEHPMLILKNNADKPGKEVYRAIRNRSVQSWGALGNVD